MGMRTVQDMKAPISSFLSMTAILATGGTALAVNATVLDPQTDSAPPASEMPVSAPVTGVAANEFQIPGIGLVTLSTIDGVLTVDTISVNDGISYTVVEPIPGEFEIAFATADRVVTFTARLVDGRIITSATGRSTAPPVTDPTVAPATVPAGPAAPAAPGYDDSDDDSYEYHDDDEYEYDDDGFDFDDHDNGDGGDDD